eukprot:5421210-Pyramimonas_sp.AAC.1
MTTPIHDSQSFPKTEAAKLKSNSDALAGYLARKISTQLSHNVGRLKNMFSKFKDDSLEFKYLPRDIRSDSRSPS